MEQTGMPHEELKLTSADLKERETILKRRDEELARRELAMDEREQAIVSQHQALEDRKTDLARREQAIVAAEWARDAGFADERAVLQIELRDRRADADKTIMEAREQTLCALETEMATVRAKRLEEISIAESNERDRIRTVIVREHEAWARLQDDARGMLGAEYAELGKQKGVLSAMQGELQQRLAELEQAERLLERKEQRLEQQWQKRFDKLDAELNIRLEEAHLSLAAQKQSFAEENSRLRDSLAVQTGLVGAFEQLKRQLGGKDPAEILRDLNSHTDALKRLREDLATRPTEEMRERNQVLELEVRNHKARADDLDRQIAGTSTAIAEVGDLRRKNSELSAENRSLVQKASIFESAASEAHAELSRLRTAYKRPAEVEARHKLIEAPHLSVDKAVLPVKTTVDEMTWLSDISRACDAYGLHFNTRILKAFHTSLKTAEWSPLTVLAGVSGTGKSELPRLYSHFGGIFFEPLSVQPNWDAQESMLGFFNSIDNQFDAQPVLRFLAQSQKPWSDDYPGLADAVCLILLDEMNLAHPELYFAEFLSKLELRRGRKGNDVPCLPVKTGAGIPPYKLPLGRNVLWAGTMNLDETTKSLSDKVIDRSIIINFPRPTELKRRLSLSPLDGRNRGATLHKTAWQAWLAQGSDFTDEEIEPFKAFIEKMNGALAVSGRALGHRVWQSVEYYMANYPDVRAASDPAQRARAMHTAFEDQLVQKVMPKLRGIETRGKNKSECLDRIREQIVAGIGGNCFNLSEDFDLACELGYGQFIWQSANYLNEPVTQIPTKITVLSANSDAGHDEEPPTSFQKREQDREKRHRAWNAKTSEQRSELRKRLEENERTGRIVAKHA